MWNTKRTSWWYSCFFSLPTLLILSRDIFIMVIHDLRLIKRSSSLFPHHFFKLQSYSLRQILWNIYAYNFHIFQWYAYIQNCLIINFRNYIVITIIKEGLVPIPPSPSFLYYSFIFQLDLIFLKLLSCPFN